MQWTDIDRNPPERVLRQFAAIWLPAFFALAGYSFARQSGRWAVTLVVWSVVAFVAIASAIKPRLIRPIFVAWMVAVFPIGWTVSRLLLALIYYAVVTPIGIGLRLAGRDPIARRFDRSAASYWTPRSQVKDAGRYFKQF